MSKTLFFLKAELVGIMVCVLILHFVAGCTLKPTKYERIVTANGVSRTTIITAGVSILTKAEKDVATVTDGVFSGSQTIDKKDEVAVPRIGAQEAVGTSLLNGAPGIIDAVSP
jgi:hypothetical protein